jgi:ubiquinone/menaquinone biosynthesis methyltransferase
MQLYDPDCVEQLFDEMAGTYEAVNYLSSFGFSRRWRHQCVGQAELGSGMVVADFMCGMGECWPAVVRRVPEPGHIIAIDFSGGMLRQAARRRERMDRVQVSLRKENALSCSVPAASVDAVFCGFGIKTLSASQQTAFAAEIARVLRPGGTFSVVEVSKPAGWFLCSLFMLYLKYVIPVLGRLMLGNPENYRMLGVYTERFGDCQEFRTTLEAAGLRTRYHRYFFGCATGVSGWKPRCQPDEGSLQPRPDLVAENAGRCLVS